jgi:hypothetical protein
LSEAQARFDGNFIFKLVGDGVLILVPGYNNINLFLKSKFLYDSLKAKNNNLNFRLVAGYGTLYCISFRTANGTLKECIGKPISFLVKVSKFVNTYKWFGNLD